MIFIFFVATVLTVYGIETTKLTTNPNWNASMLQQYLPFTVLKLSNNIADIKTFVAIVATVLTVYGIETDRKVWFKVYYGTVATVLTVYGIETNTS